MNFFKKITACFAIVTCTGLYGQNAAAEQKSIRICNESGEDVYLSIGWSDYLINQSAGWYSVQSNRCKVLYTPENADRLGSVYGYAVGASTGDEYYPGRIYDNRFCIDPTEAYNYGAATCALIDAAAEEFLDQKVKTWQKFGAITSAGLSTKRYEWTIRR